MRPFVVRRLPTVRRLPYMQWVVERRTDPVLVGGVSVVVDDTYACWVITSLWVTPAFQRQGLGTRLLNTVEHVARRNRGVLRLELDNCLDNPKSTLYTRLGFKYRSFGDNTMYKLL